MDENMQDYIEAVQAIKVAILNSHYKELPGFRGFTSRNLHYMRTFYEEWAYLETGNSIKSSQNKNLETTVSKRNRFSYRRVSVYRFYAS